MSSKDRIEALEAGAGVVETRTGKLAGSEKREAKEQEGQMELAFPPTEDEKEQEAVIEAVLFTMGRSVELRQLAASIGQPEEVARKAVERLIKRYRSARSGMEITQLEDSYQMCTKAAYYENLIRVASAPKKQVLTEVVLETLSIIAYKQPVTKMEIEDTRRQVRPRGEPSGGIQPGIRGGPPGRARPAGSFCHHRGISAQVRRGIGPGFAGFGS